MTGISVVIITRNEELNIAECIRSARQVSDDIIIVDCGSEDETLAIAEHEGARTFSIEWQGYGHSRNFGAEQARHNWIMALDADERLSPLLVASIPDMNQFSHDHVFRFRRRNYIGYKQIRLGTPGFEKVTRIYNRKQSCWDHSPVHEKLVPTPVVIHLLRGHIDHFTSKNYTDHIGKLKYYAQLCACKYQQEGRKAGLLKRFGSPFFNSFKSFVIQLGFLEGKRGFMVARAIAHYSWMKYHYLRQFNLENQQEAETEHLVKAVRHQMVSEGR